MESRQGLVAVVPCYLCLLFFPALSSTLHHTRHDHRTDTYLPGTLLLSGRRPFIKFLLTLLLFYLPSDNFAYLLRQVKCAPIDVRPSARERQAVDSTVYYCCVCLPPGHPSIANVFNKKIGQRDVLMHTYTMYPNTLNKVALSPVYNTQVVLHAKFQSSTSFFMPYSSLSKKKTCRSYTWWILTL